MSFGNINIVALLLEILFFSGAITFVIYELGLHLISDGCKKVYTYTKVIVRVSLILLVIVCSVSVYIKSHLEKWNDCKEEVVSVSEQKIYLIDTHLNFIKQAYEGNDKDNYYYNIREKGRLKQSAVYIDNINNVRINYIENLDDAKVMIYKVKRSKWGVSTTYNLYQFYYPQFN